MQKDLISRQMAIDTIMGQPPEPHYPSWYAAQIEKLPAAQPEQVCVATVTLTDEQVKEAVEKAKNAVISVIEPEPHWIPVSERLPDDDKEVLLCINNGELWLGWHNITWKTEEFYFDKEQVIAWMPLPEPYKGGEM